MIKVLEKTFAILERIVIASPRPVRISELAEDFKINPATCARILKELQEAHYVVRISRQEGYTAGPRARTFSEQVSYREEILRAAETLVEKTSRELGLSVLFCERAGLERYVLLHRCHCRKLKIVLQNLSFHDLFSTATGLVLSAFAPSPAKRDLLREYRESPFLPAGQEMRDFLDIIRNAGSFSAPYPHAGQGIMAFPVFRDGKFAGALGASVEIEYYEDPQFREKMTERVAGTARDLTQAVSRINITG